MNFSHDAFRTTRPAPTLSNDTMSHAHMVQACRFGWSASPNTTNQPPSASTAAAAPVHHRPTTTLEETRARRLSPCRGRLYHQLACSHRIRTDLVEDCGPNCLEPFGSASSIPFFCRECVDKEAATIWENREAEHNALYPPIEQMTKDQYETWYDEHRRLEARFTQDRRAYEVQVKTNTRPSNICYALELSKEEADFAAEMDALSLSLMSNDSTTGVINPQPRPRVSLPCDAAEQLHWDLNSLTIDRGSCGVEYTAGQPGQPIATRTEEQLWKPGKN